MSSSGVPPDETVFISTYSSKRNRYHVSPQCTKLCRAKNVHEKPRRLLPKELSPCPCCGDGNPERSGRAKSISCPRCGEDVSRMPAHLRNGDCAASDGVNTESESP